MKKTVLIAMILLSFSSAYSAEKPVTREWFYIAVAPSFSIADQAAGLNLRAGIPMQNGFYFVSQASYFPNEFGYKYEEFRYEFNIELTVFRVKKFSGYGTAGLNFGYWKRQFTTLYLNPPSEYKTDRSMLFGGGLNYTFKRLQVFADYKLYPEIWSQHVSLGIKLNFFANKTVKNAYFDYLKKKGRTKTIVE
ncbi:MAG: hypothetical protein ACJA0Q_000438 [Saprospiraceae bacterium]